jgi:hypothetical protein
MNGTKSSIFCSTLLATILILSTPFFAGAAALEMNGDVTVSGTLSAGTFSGSGALITDIPGSAITGTSITVNQLADGAVTPVKIGFLGKVAIVAVSGGDYDNPATAMGSYADWCENPSASNPCLLKIMPGVYNVGTSSVVMQPYIDIEGSGENTTVITGNLDSATAGIVNGANNAEIRFLTVKNIGGGANSVGIYNSSVSPKITNITVIVSGATVNSFGVNNSSSSPAMTNVTVTASGGGTGNYGIYNYPNSSPVITNASVTASGSAGSNFGITNHTSSTAVITNTTVTVSGGTNNYGIFCGTSSPAIISNVSVIGSGGGTSMALRIVDSSPVITHIYASSSGGTTANYGVHTGGGGTVYIHHSVIVGNTNTIYNASSTAVRVGASQLNGGPVSPGAGSITCVGAYNGSFAALNSSCL